LTDFTLNNYAEHEEQCFKARECASLRWLQDPEKEMQIYVISASQGNGGLPEVLLSSWHQVGNSQFVPLHSLSKEEQGMPEVAEGEKCHGQC